MVLLQTAVLEVVGRCNLNCRHCYGAFAGAGAVDVAGRWLTLIDELAALECQETCLSGGEPLLEPELVERLALRSRSKGMAVVLTTNGTLIPALAPSWFDPYSLIQVSVDGDRRSHDQMRGAGSFERTVAGIRALRRSHGEKPVRLMMTVNDSNADQLTSVLHLSRELGCEMGIERVCSVGNAAGKLSLGRDRFLRALEFAVANGVYVNDPLVALLPGRPVALHSCSAGAGAVAVGWDFECYPCTKIRTSMGSVRQEPLAKVIASWLGRYRLDDPAMLKGKCSSCVHSLTCGGCRAMALAQTGDVYGDDPMCWR